MSFWLGFALLMLGIVLGTWIERLLYRRMLQEMSDNEVLTLWADYTVAKDSRAGTYEDEIQRRGL